MKGNIESARNQIIDIFMMLKERMEVIASIKLSCAFEIVCRARSLACLLLLRKRISGENNNKQICGITKAADI